MKTVIIILLSCFLVQGSIAQADLLELEKVAEKYQRIEYMKVDVQYIVTTGSNSENYKGYYLLQKPGVYALELENERVVSDGEIQISIDKKQRQLIINQPQQMQVVGIDLETALVGAEQVSYSDLDESTGRYSIKYSGQKTSIDLVYFKDDYLIKELNIVSSINKEENQVLNILYSNYQLDQSREEVPISTQEFILRNGNEYELQEEYKSYEIIDYTLH